MKLDIKRAHPSELAAVYAEAAREYGRLSDLGDHIEANRRAKEIAAVYRELRERGGDARTVLLPLLGHQDAHVRGWAGAHLLEFAPAAAERTLSRLVESEGIVGFNASITLEEWLKGTLRFP